MSEPNPISKLPILTTLMAPTDIVPAAIWDPNKNGSGQGGWKTVQATISALATAIAISPLLTQDVITVKGIFINPTVGTINRGINLTQNTTPLTVLGTDGPWNYNVFNITNTVGSATPGMIDGTNNSNIVGVRINYTTGGPNLLGSQQGAIFAHLHNTIPNATGGDKTAVVSLAYSNVVDGGGGILAGAALNAVVDAGGTHAMVEGSEHDVGINAGGSAVRRAGIGIWNTGTVQATGALDTAIYGTSTSSAGAFKTFILLSNHAGAVPIAATGDFLAADAAQTVANIFNCTNITVTGAIAKFPNHYLGGDGAGSFGSGAAPPAGCFVYAKSTNTGNVQLFAIPDNASGFSGIQSTSSLNTNVVTFYCNEPSRNLNTFGQVIGNWITLVASGAANNGIILGTSTAKPIILGTNSAESLRIGTNGFVGISKTAGNIDPDTLLTVNANNGATIAPPVGTNVHIIGDVVAGVARTTLDGFAGSAQIFGRRTAGTRAAPTAVQANDQILALLAQGYGTTGFTAAGSTGGIGVYAKQNFTDTNAPTYIAFLTTPNASTAIVERARLGDGFMIGITADPGPGAIAGANMFISAGGGASFGVGTAPPAGILVNATITSGGTAQLLANTNGVNSVNGLAIASSLATNSLTLYANEPLRSLAIFGQTIGNWVSLIGAGSANNGMLLGTSTAKPIILGTNSVENMRIASNGNVGISTTAGNIDPDCLLTVNGNNGATIALPVGTQVHVVADTVNGVARTVWDGFAGAGQMFARRANGSRAVPTAVQADQQIAAFLGQGYGATGYIAAGSNGGIGIYAKQNFTDAAAGTYVVILTTPNGSTAIAERARVGDGLMLGTTTDPGAGALLANTSIKSQGATSGIGYATGAGGSVTQATDKSTGVTLNKVTGEIVMNASSMTTGLSVGFTLTNSAIAATDVVVVNIKSGATVPAYLLIVDAVAAGSCHITVRNMNASTLAEAIVLSFAVLKGVVA